MRTRRMLPAALLLLACAPLRTGSMFDGSSRWTTVTRLTGGDTLVGSLEIRRSVRGLAGVVRMGRDSDLVNVRINEVKVPHHVWFAIPTRETPGAETDRFVTVVALVQPDGSLAGRWHREDGRSGDWTARPDR